MGKIATDIADTVEKLETGIANLSRFLGVILYANGPITVTKAQIDHIATDPDWYVDIRDGENGEMTLALVTKKEKGLLV